MLEGYTLAQLDQYNLYAWHGALIRQALGDKRAKPKKLFDRKKAERILFGLEDRGIEPLTREKLESSRARMKALERRWNNGSRG